MEHAEDAALAWALAESVCTAHAGGAWRRGDAEEWHAANQLEVAALQVQSDVDAERRSRRRFTDACAQLQREVESAPPGSRPPPPLSAHMQAAAERARHEMREAVEVINLLDDERRDATRRMGRASGSIAHGEGGELRVHAVPSAAIDAQRAAFVAVPQRRSDPSDGVLRTRAQFAERRGDGAAAAWREAEPFRVERRRAPDGDLYNERQFNQWFDDGGAAWAASEWGGARVARPTTSFDATRGVCTYLLVDGAGENYLGCTTEVTRRVREHNGELSGGAARTLETAHAPWRLVLAVFGFASFGRAHAFESMWHHPDTAFYLTPMQRSTPRRPLHLRRLRDNVDVLITLLDGWHTHAPDARSSPLRVVDGDGVNALLQLPPLELHADDVAACAHALEWE